MLQSRELPGDSSGASVKHTAHNTPREEAGGGCGLLSDFCWQGSFPSLQRIFRSEGHSSASPAYELAMVSGFVAVTPRA